MTSLVYIGGYGRSGSTLLEYLMTANAGVLACGEVGSDEHVNRKRKKCTCRRLAHECPIWSPVLRQDGGKRQRHEDLDLALLEQAAGRYSVMIDSSKTAWWRAAIPFRLRRKLGEDFTLLHIVRDPRAVCWSLIKRSERGGQQRSDFLQCAAATAGWWFANIACELFGWLHPRQYRRIRYEDLVHAAPELLPRLLDGKQTDAPWDFAAIGASGNRHQLFGNRMRRRALSLADIKEDTAWRSEMPQAPRRFVAGLAWPLRRRYDY